MIREEESRLSPDPTSGEFQREVLNSDNGKYAGTAIRIIKKSEDNDGF